MSIISRLRNCANHLDVRTSAVFAKIGVVGAVCLLAMMVIVVLDALGKRFFSLPIHGSYEIGTFLLIIVFFTSLAYCTMLKGHFVINVITSHLRKRARFWLATLVYFISALLCWLLTSQLVVLSMKIRATNLTGAQLTFVPIFIFILLGAFCMAIAGWGFLLQFMNYLGKAIEGE